MNFNIGIRIQAISVQANLRKQVKPRSGGRNQNAYNSDMRLGILKCRSPIHRAIVFDNNRAASCAPTCGAEVSCG